MSNEKDQAALAKTSPDVGNREGADRRVTPRVDRLTLLQFSKPEAFGFQVDLAIGRTINLSLGGARMEVKRHYPIPLKSILGLRLTLEGDVVDVRGRVVYLQLLDEERCAIGVQFQDTSPEILEKIRKVLRKAEKRSSPASGC